MVSYYKTISDYPSATGLMPMLYSIRDGIPFAFEAVLMVIFILLFGGNYFIIKARTGRVKILIALLSSSIGVTVLTILLAMAQLVTFRTTLLYAFMSIVFFVLLVISDNN